MLSDTGAAAGATEVMETPMTRAFRIPTAVRTVVAAGLIGAATFGLAGCADADAAPPAVMHGDPVAAAQYWHQADPGFNSTALMAVGDVVGQVTGISPTATDLIALAQTAPSATHGGAIYTLPAANIAATGRPPANEDLPILLAHYGIASSYHDGTMDDDGTPTGISAVQQYLDTGRRVIAFVDYQTLWGKPSGEVGDEAVVITGVDTDHGMVHLNDSGNAQGRNAQIPLDTFQRGWNHSGEAMVVTRGVH